MIARKTNSPRGIARPAQRASRLPSSNMGSRDNLNHGIGRHSPVGSEAADVIPQNLADQPGTVVLIGMTIPGLGGLGKVALPFIYRPFHSAASSHGEPENNARQY